MKTTLLILLSSITLLFAACNGKPSCPDASEEKKLIPDYDKVILPYKGLDTIYFLTNTNDTITLLGNGIRVSFEIDYVREPNPDCNIYNKVSYEVNNFDFGPIQIKQHYKDYFSDIFLNNQRAYSFPYETIGSKLVDPKINVVFLDSLEINGEKYFKVSKFSGIDTSDKIYINRLYGILKIENKTQNINWSKIKT